MDAENANSELPTLEELQRRGEEVVERVRENIEEHHQIRRLFGIKPPQEAPPRGQDRRGG